MIFVIGATGKVGRHVVSGLLDRGTGVRALARDPAATALPEGAEVVAGDLTDLDRLQEQVDDADAVFLVWPFVSDEGAAATVNAIAHHTRRIVYLSAQAADEKPDSFWAVLERLIERSGVDWTFLRPTGFAANTLMWADQIRQGDVVRWVSGQAARSLIDERDIAAVAVRALTEDRHRGARYVLSGPETVTQLEQVQAIGEAIGRPLRWEELSGEDVREQIADLLGKIPDSALDTWAAFVDTPERVTTTVQDITGTRARSFSEWALDHAEQFR